MGLPGLEPGTSAMSRRHHSFQLRASFTRKSLDYKPKY